MIVELNELLMSFRPCFSRKSTFAWFMITVIGLIVRSDDLGITSIIRDLAINPDFVSNLYSLFS